MAISGVKPKVVISPNSTVELKVEVKDKKIREETPEFDGMEKIFAMVPFAESGQVSWKRFDLDYAGNHNGIDQHMMSLADCAAAVREYGVAFGMESNVGTSWLQGLNQNIFPTGVVDVELSKRSVKPKVSITPENKVKLAVEVNDEEIRKKIPAFDGREDIFVMVPTSENGQVVWKRHEMDYSSTKKGLDKHKLELSHCAEEVQKYGVAFGLDSNAGTVWLQKPNANFFPSSVLDVEPPGHLEAWSPGYQKKISNELTRGSQPGNEQLAKLKQKGFRSVINLRNRNTAESPIVASYGMKPLYVAVHDQRAPSRQQVADFLDFVTRRENQPAYLHCRAGEGRTGTFVACWRMVVQGWNTKDAIKEAKASGVGSEDQLRFLKQFGKDVESGKIARMPAVR